MTTDSGKNGAITLSRINFSGHVGHAVLYMYLVECLLLCAVSSTELRLRLRIDFVFDWLEVMHTYLHYFSLSLSRQNIMTWQTERTFESQFCPVDEHVTIRISWSLFSRKQRHQNLLGAASWSGKSQHCSYTNLSVLQFWSIRWSKKSQTITELSIHRMI